MTCCFYKRHSGFKEEVLLVKQRQLHSPATHKESARAVQNARIS
jgi:hypothetical protein